MTGWTSELRGAMDTLSSYRIEIVSETWQTEKKPVFGIVGGTFLSWFSDFRLDCEKNENSAKFGLN